MTDSTRSRIYKRHHELTVKMALGMASPEEAAKQKRYQQLRRAAVGSDTNPWVTRQDRFVEFVLKDLKRYTRMEAGLKTSPIAMRHPPKTVRYPF